MSGTVALGKQCLSALKKCIFLVMESQTISVKGQKSGRGGVGYRLCQDKTEHAQHPQCEPRSHAKIDGEKLFISSI